MAITSANAMGYVKKGSPINIGNIQLQGGKEVNRNSQTNVHDSVFASVKAPYDLNVTAPQDGSAKIYTNKDTGELFNPPNATNTQITNFQAGTNNNYNATIVTNFSDGSAQTNSLSTANKNLSQDQFFHASVQASND